MKNKGSLDANILLRWLLDDIPEQTSAVDALFMKSGKYQVSDLAIIEVAFILEKKLSFPRPLVAENIFQIIENSKISCNSKLFSHSITHYIQKPKLSFVDCCLAVLAELSDALPLYTFDKKLASQLDCAELLEAQARRK